MGKLKLPTWAEVYPQGTQEGDEEQDFFIALSRKSDDWRTTKQICKDSKLSLERVEELIDKYVQKGLVIPHPSKEDTWGYWERVPGSVPNKEKSISQWDHKKRIDDHLDTSEIEVGESVVNDTKVFDVMITTNYCVPNKNCDVYYCGTCWSEENVSVSYTFTV